MTHAKNARVMHRWWLWVAVAVVPMILAACTPRTRDRDVPPVASARVALAPAPVRPDALALSDALEELIATGSDTSADRERTYKQVCAHEEDTAGYTFARAAVTGRLVQARGFLAASLVGDVERFARRSRELDPGFRDGAATRLLGTLYVLAPAALLKHGDSERGIELLEQLTKQSPELPENHLRLAEAYVALGDPTPARPHICRCFETKTSLRPDDQALLARLANDVQPLRCGRSH